MKPSFTLSDVKRAIPSHCFERSLLRSSLYLLHDVAAIAVLVYSTTWFDAPFVSPVLRWCLLWPVYWFFCGAYGTGVWVIAHECGHGAYAPSPLINDAVGFVTHSILLVPYFSWYPPPGCHINTCETLGSTRIGVIIQTLPIYQKTRQGLVTLVDRDVTAVVGVCAGVQE